MSLSLVANEVMEGGPEAAEIRLVSLAGGGGVGVSLVLKAPSPGSSLWAWALTQQARVARHGVGISDCPLPVLTYAMFIYKTSLQTSQTSATMAVSRDERRHIYRSRSDLYHPSRLRTIEAALAQAGCSCYLTSFNIETN